MESILFWDSVNHGELFVFIEDPRKAVYKRQDDIHKAQGAGSVKRDATIWEDFLTDKRIPFAMVRPVKEMTKWSDAYFRKVTGYTGQTSVHARDAAMLVYGR